ncbi:MAG: CDP-alcohol phosphatidyltransferase family protein [Rhodospirillales bacterium]|nr:CDP-alcohol phosphatidyltransferase family protein [Rhodospirillales bacterium]
MADGGQGLGRAASDQLVTLPNLITFARLCAVPLAFWFVISHRPDWAFLLFLGAGVSDAVDGWLARRWGGGSQVGAVIDPVADKALLVTMFITLAAVGQVPTWLAVLVVFRDIVIVGGVLVLGLLGRAVTIRPLLVSKLNTALQIALVALSLFMAGYHVRLGWADTGMALLVWAVAASTLASGAAYVWRAARGE